MKKLVFKIFLLLTIVSLKGADLQEVAISPQDPVAVSERVFMHFNSSFLLVGESLLYSLYCFENDKNKASTLSKIAYVELINRNLEVIFKHKIALEGGRGYSNFKLPSSVPSGHYKLVGYTKLIQRHNPKGAFVADLHVLNPYESQYDPLEVVLKKDTDSSVSISKERNWNGIADQKGPLKLHLSRTQIGPREKLEIALQSEDPKHSEGSYSISVRKLDGLIGPVPPISTAFGSAISTGSMLRAPNYLLDLRGDLLEGQIVSRAGDANLENEKIALSIPGDDFYFNLTKTTKQGRFFLTIDSENRAETAFIQILGRSAEDYEIKLIENHGWTLQNQEFESIEIPIALRDIIEKRSLYNQIENAYAEAKPDQVSNKRDIIPFYRNLQYEYVLDEYTRFNTVKETMVEIIDDVWIQTLANGSAFFKVREADFTQESPFLPLVFVDGLFLSDQESFLSYPSNKIVSIGFSRDKFRFGSHIFQGILSISTEKRDYYQNFVGKELTKIQLPRPQPKIQYYQPNYQEKNASKSVPDFRQQLLWIPEVELSSTKKTLHLYTSDNPGTYEIVVQGFSANGKAVFLYDTFEFSSGEGD